MLIELSLLCYCRYRERRLRRHLEHYPPYLLKDMGLRREGNRIVSDRDDTVTDSNRLPDLPAPRHPLAILLRRMIHKRV